MPLLFAALLLARAPDLKTLVGELQSFPAGAARTIAASDRLVGLPYLLHPLGDGVRIGGREDPSQRFRLDRFDCQTFVETALALGESETPDQVRRALDDLRYGGEPSYANRNHFMMSQWVPHNEVKGYLADATRSLDPAASDAIKAIDARSWERRDPKNIVLPRDRIPIGRFTLPMISLPDLLRLAPTLPEGTLILVIRSDRPRFPDRVTHLGLLLHRQGHALLRHASDVFHRVVDEPLEHFVARDARYGWKVEGVSLLFIRDNAGRVARLPPVPNERGD